MSLNIFRKKPTAQKRKRSPGKRSRKTQSNVSTKQDVERVLNEVIASRNLILQEVTKLPESLSSRMVDHITSPLKAFLAEELRTNASQQLSIPQAVTQEDPKR